MTPMPIELIGRYYNGGCTEPCDMIDGPCACGAWHRLDEWPKELEKEANAETKASI